MIQISFNTVHVPWPFLNQTQDSQGRWNNLDFALNPLNNEQAEYLIVYDDIRAKIKTKLPKDRRILFIAEPPSIASYPAKYLNQFGIVVCPYNLDGFKNKQIRTQTSLPWHFGVNRGKGNAVLMDFASLAKYTPENKVNKISVVCSNKAMTPEHRQRLEFVQKAKAHFGDRMDVFGRGFTEIDDKAQAILPYHFHLVLENNFVDHFWTEKLADAYLGLAYPFYSGCKNISQYFDADMLTEIDINSPDDAIQKIEKALNQADFYQQHQASLQKAKQRVMDKYNLFAVIEQLINENKPADKKMLFTASIKPAKECRKTSKKLIDILYPYKVKLANLRKKWRERNV